MKKLAVPDLQLFKARQGFKYVPLVANTVVRRIKENAFVCEQNYNYRAIIIIIIIISVACLILFLNICVVNYTPMVFCGLESHT